MMKVLKYQVDFESFYGLDVHEYCLMPVEFIESYSCKEEFGVTYDDAVYLGEIAGKHSECYGDLIITVVDLNELNVKAANELINNQSAEEFECYFEGVLEELDEMIEDEEITQETIEKNRKTLIEKYNVIDKGWGISGEMINESFIKFLKQKYQVELSTITIKQEDHGKVAELLKENGIKYYL